MRIKGALRSIDGSIQVQNAPARGAPARERLGTLTRAEWRRTAPAQHVRHYYAPSCLQCTAAVLQV